MKYFKNVLKNIYLNITTKQVIVIGAVFVLFTALALPSIAKYTADMIGVSESPDTSFSFDINGLYSLLQSYGKDGRRFYIVMRWTFDVVWPFIYTVFLVGTIAYLSRRSNCKFGFKPLYVPIFAVMFDFLENIFATIVMAIYPTEVDLFGYLLFISSIIKWGLISFSFIIVVVFLIRFIVKVVKKDARE